MVRFTVYGDGVDPEPLYERGVASATGADRVTAVAGAGARPLDLLVDLRERSVLWTFVGEFRGEPPRAGYFLAAYQASAGDLFGGFAEELRALRADEEWALARDDDLRWDAGFRLSRVAPDLPGLTGGQRQRLYEHLASDGEPLAFRMGGYRAALQVLRAVQEAGLGITVAVDGERREAIPAGVDLLLCPTGEADFEPISDAADALVGPASEEVEATGIADGGTSAVRRWQQRAPGRSLGTAAWATVGLLLVLAAYSMVSTDPVHPITGLATVGGLVGALLGFPGAAALALGDADPEDADVVSASVRALRQRRPLAGLAVAYGTLLGFAYPSVFRVAGELTGSSWLFGYVSGLSGGIPSVFALVAASFLGTWLLADRVTPGPLGRTRTLHLLVAHAVYALPLLVATGLARSVWFRFVPAV